MNLSFKAEVVAVMCILCFRIASYGQTSDLLKNHPRWTYGIYAGAGLTSLTINPNKYSGSINVYGQESSFANSLFDAYSEISLGGYATRRLNNRWSLRSELLFHRKNYGSTALSVGLFPRYRVLPWLQLEAGVEARQTLSGADANESKFWLGAAFGRKDLEFNIRFAPGFIPGKNGNSFMRTTQVGVSLPLNNLGRSSRKKK